MTRTAKSRGPRASRWSCSSRLIGAAALAALGAGLGGCTQATGDFDGIAWSPTITRFAVAQRHVLAEVDGSLQAALLPEEDRTLTMVFTTAWANPDEEWRRYPTRSLLEIRRDFATTDGLLLWDIPLAALEAGAELSLDVNTNDVDAASDFQAAVVVDTSVATSATNQGLGSVLEMKLSIDEVDAKAHGSIAGNFELKRSRGDQQDGEIATGEVTVAFSMPIVAERRGKANLAVASPIMRCAAAAGPSRATVCLDEPVDPIPEATDTIDGM